MNRRRAVVALAGVVVAASAAAVLAPAAARGLRAHRTVRALADPDPARRHAARVEVLRSREPWALAVAPEVAAAIVIETVARFPGSASVVARLGELTPKRGRFTGPLHVLRSLGGPLAAGARLDVAIDLRAERPPFLEIETDALYVLGPAGQDGLRRIAASVPLDDRGETITRVVASLDALPPR